MAEMSINRDVMILREVITKLTQILAGKGFKVTQRGLQAFVEVDPRTLRPISVNLPYIPDNASEDLILAIQGFLDHEVAHILHTDFTVVAEATKKGSSWHWMHNVVEDTFIERAMGEMLPGSVFNLGRLHGFFIKHLTKKALEDAKTDQNRFEVLMIPLLRGLSGQRVFATYLDEIDAWSVPLVKAFVENCPEELFQRIPKIKNSREAWAVAQELHDFVFPPPPPPLPAPAPTPAPAPQQKQPPQDPGEGEGEGEGAGEPTADPCEGEPNEAEGKSSASDEGAAEPAEADDDDGDPIDEDEGDADHDGETPESEKDEEDAEAGATPDDTKAEPEAGEGEADDDADGSDDAGDPGAAEGEADSEADGKDGDGGADVGDDDDAGDEEEDSPDAAAGGGADDPSDAEAEAAAEDDGGESDADDSSGAGSEDGEEDEKDPAEGEAPLGGGGKSDPQPPASDDLDAPEVVEDAKIPPGAKNSPFTGIKIQLPRDMMEAIAATMGDETARATKDAPYRVFTKDYDVIKPYEVSDEFKDEHLTELEDRTRPLTGVMQKDIERMLAARSQSVNVPGYRSGRLHGGSLHRLTVKDERVFRRKVVNPSKETAVGLLIDNSGSMSGEKMKLAMTAGFALSSTLERVNVPHEVIGFTTKNYTINGKELGLYSRRLSAAEQAELQKIQDEMADAQQKMGMNYSRVVPIYMPIYKEFGERLTPAVKRRFADAIEQQSHLASNVDGECVDTAVWRLSQRQEARKVLLVLSDGQPSGGDYAEGCSNLHRAVRNAKKLGVEVIGIGIMDQSVRTFYPKAIVINDVAMLPAAVMGELKTILLAP